MVKPSSAYGRSVGFFPGSPIFVHFWLNISEIFLFSATLNISDIHQLGGGGGWIPIEYMYQKLEHHVKEYIFGKPSLVIMKIESTGICYMLFC